MNFEESIIPKEAFLRFYEYAQFQLEQTFNYKVKRLNPPLAIGSSFREILECEELDEAFHMFAVNFCLLCET